MALRIFAQITKVDVAKRQVWGRATQEIVDKSKEIFDYDSSVPLFKAWSEGFAANTDGKSLGNIRGMHGKSCAGKVIQIDFNDLDKAVDIGTKIVNDNEWKMVEEGCYTGFSIGGSYVKKWADPTDPTLTRFTADPAEISLVDSPCVPTAKFFDVIKADGVVEKVAFQEPTVKVATLGELRKGMWTVQDFAGVLSSIGWMAQDSAMEAEWEGDNSPVPAALADWLAQGAKIFQDMAAEELKELLATLPKPTEVQIMTMAAGFGLELAKKGAKFSVASKAKLDEAHQAAMDAHETLGKALGAVADCWKGNDMEAAAQADFEKLQGDAQESIQKAAGLTADLEKANTTISTLEKRVKELEALPEPPKGALHGAAVSVSKTEDASLNNLSATPQDDLKKEIEAMPDGPDKAMALIKLAHLTGGR